MPYIRQEIRTALSLLMDATEELEFTPKGRRTRSIRKQREARNLKDVMSRLSHIGDRVSRLVTR